MKIDKAIEILTTAKPTLTNAQHPYIKDAYQLGIEALTFISRLRAFSMEWRRERLPSEDKIGQEPVPAEEIRSLRESPLGRELRG